jgi:hypothetical protein
MRFIDFMVFYIMANFKRKKIDGSMWGSQLGRAVFLASLNLSFILLIVVEIICAFIFRRNIFDAPYFEIAIIVVGVLNAQIVGYIYINKERYSYITSPEYKPFKLSITTGVAVSFLLFLILFIAAFGTALIINSLLK